MKVHFFSYICIALFIYLFIPFSFFLLFTFGFYMQLLTRKGLQFCRED
jgi:hypothetical protein